MAFLKLISDNKNLSWVLEKNPETGIVIKSNRQGYLFGFYPINSNVVNTAAYCIYFKDASDEVSYKKHPDESFEYLSSSKYTNARFIVDAIDEMLASARKGVHSYQEKGEEYDIASHHHFFINVVETHYKTIDIFQRYFNNIKIESKEVIKNHYQVTFSTVEKCTLSYFLNLISLFGIFAVLNSNDFIYVHEGMPGKYLKILNKIDAPYFIRYLFKVRLLRSEQKYNQHKDELEKTNLYSSLKLTYGDSHDARIDFIKSKVDLGKPIIDIGAGIDFRYLKIFGPKLQEKNLKYYAIEKDYDASERIKAGIRNRQLDNTELFESLDNLILVNPDNIKNNVSTIICTEVLEHNEIEEAKGILKNIFDNFNFDQILISVPNRAFNKYYGFNENDTRHDDHKWEYTKNEFMAFIKDYLLTNNYNFHCEFHDVGDIIDGDSVSTGLIVKKK